MIITKLPKKLTGLTPVQKDYLNDPTRFIVVTSGRRSRKSLIGKRKILLSALENPDHSYFFAAPTRSQAKAIFWNDLKRDTHYFRKDKSETDLIIILKNNTMIQVLSMERPDRIEGQPWNGGHITEAGTCVTKEKWMENIRPVFSDTKGFCILDGVPEGRNYYFDLALRCWKGNIDRPVPMFGAVGKNDDNPGWIHYNWFSSDVLDEEELRAAKRDMSERLYKQEYEGAFIDYSGLAYWNFGEKNIRKVDYNQNEFVAIGMDFNVNPMTAVLGHLRIDKGIERFYQFGEIRLPNSNTWEMVENIENRFDLRNQSRKRAIEIFPDSTGKSERSNATRSDISILQQSGFVVKAFNKNPRQKDRVNCVNNCCGSQDGTIRYYVDPNCKYTIEDLRKVECLDDGSLDKSAEKDGLIHQSDGLGYLLYYKFPVRGKDKSYKK